jgi:hypothetical protein
MRGLPFGFAQHLEITDFSFPLSLTAQLEPFFYFLISLTAFNTNALLARAGTNDYCADTNQELFYTEIELL